jgi:hypothetical protein
MLASVPIMQGSIRPFAGPVGLVGRSGARSERPAPSFASVGRSRRTELLILCARIGFNP